MTRTKKISGFTLIEILIVVIILGILAAIVIPQFTNASTEAKESSMASQLQTLRSQIGLYKVQHTNDTAPTLWTQLTTQTNPAGSTPGTGDQVLGPYFDAAVTNPLVPSADSTAVGIVTASGAVTPDGTHAWYYNATTGEIHGVAPSSANDGTFILSDDGQTAATFSTGTAGGGT